MNHQFIELLNVIETVHKESNLHRLLKLILEKLLQISGAERGFILLCDDGELKIEAAHHLDESALKKIHEPISKTILKKVFSERRPILLIDALQDPQLGLAESVRAHGIRAVCVLPLMFDEQIVGAVYLDHSKKPGIFAQRDLQILTAFATQAAIAIHRARLLKQITQLKGKLEEKVQLQEEQLQLHRAELMHRYRQTQLVGKSKPMRELFRKLEKIAIAPFPVLISGESGTGKELVAKAIHYTSQRRGQPFIATSCGELTDSIIESELFGYRKGAFTGAISNRPGLFELANQGTLFLDEIGNMTQRMQEALLRVLQESEIRPLGASRAIKIDVRLITATNEDLIERVERGSFRQDLYYRLSVLKINLAPLRERMEDIPILVEHFLERVAQETRYRKHISKDGLQRLIRHNWPGNVRELENVIRQAVILSEGELISERDIDRILKDRAPWSLKEVLSLDDYIRAVLEKYGGRVDINTLAQRLGISRKTLWEKKKKLGISEGEM
jgi:Nif-specific regulatory protein